MGENFCRCRNSGAQVQDGRLDMKITISATLRSFFGRRDEIEIQGNTIKDILAGLRRSTLRVQKVCMTMKET